MKKQILSLGLATAVLLVTPACAPKHVAKVDRESGQLELEYTPAGGGGLEGRTLGIQAFRFESERTSQPNPYAMLMMRQPGYRQVIGLDGPAKQRFAEAYARGLEEIITARGGKVAGPFESYEEIAYGQKERMMLLIEPKLRINVLPVKTSTRDESMGAAHEETGVYVARAEGVLKFREPMTNEVVMVKRIRSEVKSQPYHHAYKTSTSGDNLVIGLIKQAAVSKFEEKDDRLKRRNEALSGLYTKIMASLDAALDPREVAMHEQEIQRLKQIKRY